jgi:hypothetical protein
MVAGRLAVPYQRRLCGKFPDVGSGRDGASRPADRDTDTARRGHTGKLASTGIGLSASAQHKQLDPVRTFASSAQGTVTYTAMHPGRATLVTKANCLPSGPLRSEPKNCPVIDVTVISGPQIPGDCGCPDPTWWPGPADYEHHVMPGQPTAGNHVSHAVDRRLCRREPARQRPSVSVSSL